MVWETSASHAESLCGGLRERGEAVEKTERERERERRGRVKENRRPSRVSEAFVSCPKSNKCTHYNLQRMNCACTCIVISLQITCTVFGPQTIHAILVDSSSKAKGK